MKKLIFLLVVLTVGFGAVFASTNPAQPPVVFDHEAVSAEYGIHEGIVTQPTVTVSALSFSTEPSVYQAVMAYDLIAVKPGGVSLSKRIKLGQIGTDYTDSDYYLRC